jgi:hypothetical protein
MVDFYCHVIQLNGSYTGVYYLELLNKFGQK